jgi:hypothetical protein
MSQRYAGGMITANQSPSYSGLFNNGTNYLSLAGAAQYAIANSTTPFTIEAWINPTLAGSVIFAEQYAGAGTIAIGCSLATVSDVSVAAGLYPAFGWFNGSAWTTAAASTTQIVLNTWTHIAFVFTGSTSKIYINGVDVTKPSSPTPATTWGVTGVNGDGWYIGKRWDTGASQYFKGYISNLRFVNGTAVYTSEFIVPARLSAIPNTVLLTCQDATYVDNSIYAAAITSINNTPTSEFNPFYAPSSPALGAATPGVWTLSQANQAAAQRSWPMYDPDFFLNTGVVHGNGTNGGNNNTFLDSSTNNFSVTRNGNATQGTFTPFSRPNGWWSNYFDGTGDYLTIPDNAALEFGTGNFCVEMWFCTLASSAAQYNLTTKRRIGSTTGAPFQIWVATNGVVNVGFSAGANFGVGIREVGRVTDGTWHHVAAYRIGNAWYGALDGVVTVINANNAGTSNNNEDAVVIGGDTNSNYFWGYISNYRIVVGSSVYTANSFTPQTTPLSAITNTQVLTCQSNRFVDNSPNNFTVSKFNDARVMPFQPFYAPTAYTPEVNGGGMAFDGTGDYLTIADNALLEPAADEFCIEALFYTATVAAGTAIIISKRATSAGFGPILIARSTATITISLSSNNSSYDIADAVSLGTITTNQWYHVAVYRIGNAWYGSLNGTITTLNGSNSSSLADTADSWLVGADTNGNGFNGFISNPRFTIGSPVYSSGSAPVPTAPLTDITDTQLLLSGTNAAIFDNAGNLIIETVNTEISTSQNKYGSGTIAFNGTNAYAKLISPFGSGDSYGPNVIQTRGDFTIEAWVNPTNTSASRTMFCINSGNTSYAAARLDHTAAGLLQLLVSFNNVSWSINLTSAVVLPSGVWTHLAIVRAGPSIILYMNGLPILTSTTITMANTLYVGLKSILGARFSTTYQDFFNGYMSDFRATNYARYLGQFTPPTSTLQNQ